MARLHTLLALLAAGAGHAAVLSESEGANPVGKVVKLLSEMKEQVDADAEADLKAYEKYMCWCTTTEKEKVAAIEFAGSEIQRLTTFLEEGEAKEAELKTQISTLEEEIAEAKDALASATALRNEEHDKFLAEEQDMKESRGLLKQAVDVLTEVQLIQKQGASQETIAEKTGKAVQALVQVRSRAIRTSSPRFRSTMQQDLYDVLGSLQRLAPARGGVRGGAAAGPRAAEEVTALAQRRLLPWEKTDEQIGKEAKPNDLTGAASGAKSYNARSGRILGILSEMHDEFTRDLGSAQYSEYLALVSFHKLKSAKISEIFIASETKDRKEAALADLLNKMAQAKEQREEMEAAKAADETFLAQMQEGCRKEDEEYHKRLAVRSEELRALTETLKILTAEEARATFSRSTLSLLQETSGRSERRAAARERATERAMQRIARVAKAHKNWAMLSLAIRVRLDSFTKVIEMMDKMTVELKKQQKDEYEKHEFCKQEIDETEDLIKVHTNTKETLDEQHLALTDKLASLKKDIDTLKKEVADMEVSLKDAGEQRKAENALYQQSIMDQRAAVNILNKALERLKMFYSKDATFVQTRQGQPVPGAAAAPPPPRGQAYSSSGGAGGVLQMMMTIITDAEAEEKELDVTENNAQRRYAEFVTDATASIEADREAITGNEKLVASTEAQKAEVEGAQLSNDEELGRLGDLLKAHHLDCDFLLKYFDLRQKFRGEELDSIADAKAILSGADFGK